ncbi:hypothetical protein LOTGIDRAFT_168136 [Lottia gigantea]|uniref:TIR domain-containing protein n=1 Tax=Lottia gigantea TaxID=225164 RepID=V3ZRC5_LOTGI|nr:hypothetical protein LOTGIDRAFT_168136 [Lottia gigantea]ESO85110.1 hypothetical protein LOTGIDRAFT_168136 [Lottia gigantea]
MENFSLIFIVLNVYCVLELVIAKPQQRSFDVRWPNGSAVSIHFPNQKESGCILDRVLDNLICMKNWPHYNIIGKWKYYPEHIKYVSVRCHDQSFLAEHQHNCYCKHSNITTSQHPGKHRDDFNFCQLHTISYNVFYQLSNVQVVDLGSNLLKEIPVGLFKNQKSLSYLDLSNNPLRDMPLGLFCNLSKLQIILLQHLSLEIFPWSAFSCVDDTILNVKMIDLSMSHISQIADQSFRNIPNLEFLNLTSNLLHDLPPTPFHGATSLKYLDLSENFISRISQDFCDGLHKLEKLFLRGNSFQYMDFAVFAKCDHIHHLDISKNLLEHLQLSSSPHFAMKNLNLSDNDLEQIPAFFFNQSYTELEYLDISDNDIRFIENGAFTGLNNLVFLDLSWNLIEVLSDLVFEDLDNLVHLDLGNNMIAAIEPATLGNLTALQELHLNYNHISTIGNIGLDNLENLLLLRLDNNHITNIPEALFGNLTSLNVLNLSRNHLEFIQNTTFHAELVVLDLSFNMLKELPVGKGLKTLLLRRNHITWIPLHVFDAMTQLEVLDLSFNRITTLDTKSFDELVNIQLLDLRQNEIHTILKSEDFDMPPLFHKLDLSHNNVTNISDIGVCGFLHSVINLDLSYNPIETIYNVFDGGMSRTTIKNFVCQYCQLVHVADTSFEHVPSLTMVDLSNNKLSHFQPFFSSADFNLLYNPVVCTCDMKWLKEKLVVVNNIPVHTSHYIIRNCFTYPKLGLMKIADVPSVHFLCQIPNCTNLCKCYTREIDLIPETVICSRNLTSIPTDLPMSSKEIYLDGNDLEHSAFQAKPKVEFSSLEEIYLNSSKFQGLADDFFSNMLSLKKINLSDNSIINLASNTFHKLGFLEELYLDNNGIRTIPAGLLEGLVNLKLLSLQNNKLHFLLPETISELSVMVGFRWIILSNNPWICNCQNIDLIDWVKGHRSRVFDRRHVRCGEIDIMSFDRSKLQCSNDSHQLSAIVGILASCFLVLIALISICIYSNRKNIIALGYSRMKIENFHCFKNVVIRNDYLYDMVIIFDENDSKCRWWVTRNLIPRLTKRNWKFRIYIPNCENNTPDMLIHEIRDNIRHSQCTLFLLTKNFIYSHICTKSFKYAKYDSRHFGHLILIIAWGELTRGLLESDARTFLLLGNYLKIRERFVIDKLICLMPTPLSDITLSESSISDEQNVIHSSYI